MASPTIGIKAIAAAGGVSIATVSRYLSGKTIRPAYRARVEAALASLDYRPNLAARRLRSGDAGLIGLVVPDIANPFFVAMIRAIETLAWREGCRILLCNSNEDPRREAHLLAMLTDERVSGIILAPALGSDAPATDIPTVLVDRSLSDRRHDTVMLDNPAAAAALVEALYAKGCRRILGLFGVCGTTAEQRHDGFGAWTAARGLPLLTQRVPYDRVARAAVVRDAITTHAPDAIVCGDSLVLLDAAVAIADAQADGLRLAGFDDAAWLRLIPGGTIVLAQPVDEMAHAALALLMARMVDETGEPVAITFRGSIVRSGDPDPFLPSGG